MKKFWMVLLLAVAAMAQQDTKAEKPAKPMEQKLFILKYADPGQLSPLLGIFGASVRQSPELHAITVEASPEAMRAIEDAIQKLDVPSATPKECRNDSFSGGRYRSAAAAGSAIPKDLDSVVTQLKNTFPFKNYGLLDVIDIPYANRTDGDALPVRAAQCRSGNKPSPVITTQLGINSIAAAERRQCPAGRQA